MAKVKFNVNSEYGYLQNFKILQSILSLLSSYSLHIKFTNPTDTFAKHQIERNVPVESLVKCKMQDNLEFLQWTKRFWDQYFSGSDYDALSRRKGSSTPSAGPPPAARTSGASTGAVRRGTTPTAAAAARPARTGGVGAASSAVLAENNQLKETVTGLERERDFYFSKLRDIELLIQQAIELDPEIEKDEGGLVKQIQAILYSTEVSIQFDIKHASNNQFIRRVLRYLQRRET